MSDRFYHFAHGIMKPAIALMSIEVTSALLGLRQRGSIQLPHWPNLRFVYVANISIARWL